MSKKQLFMNGDDVSPCVLLKTLIRLATRAGNHDLGRNPIHGPLEVLVIGAKLCVGQELMI